MTQEMSEWIVAFLLGAALVVIYSLSRFDEPSYDSQTEFFSRYRPRFSTSHASYFAAKLGYVAAIFLIYSIFSLMPKAFGAVTGNSLLSPMAIAMYIVTIQNVPLLKDIEGKIRGVLHGLAQVPEGIRRTIAQMRGSEFKFDPAARLSQARKISPQTDPAAALDPNLDNLISEDEVLNSWFCIGCILCCLSEQNRSKSGIDPLFFEYYRDEFESIRAKHAILVDDVRQYLDSIRQRSASISQGSFDGGESSLFGELRTLRDRLFTFVACGVRCSVQTEVESADILRRLGFSSRYAGTDSHNIGEITALLMLSLMIVSVFFVFSAKWVRSTSEPVANALMLPESPVESFIFSIAAALFYFAAIIGALWARQRGVRRHEWFDINALSRRRPWLKYMNPTVIGLVCGGGTLFVIALLCGPGVPCDPITLGSIHVNSPERAFGQAFLWSPLAIVVAFAALWLSDTAATSEGESAPWRKFIVQGFAGALCTALMASLILPDLEPKDFSKGDMLIARLFVPGQILLLVFVMFMIVQAYEFYGQDARRLVGRGIQAISPRGPIFAMLLDPTGKASRFAANEKHFNATNALSHGRWLAFPEGTVIQWLDKGDDSVNGDLGLIASSEEILTYQAFNDRISGLPEYIAQLDLRAVPAQI